MEHLDFLTPLCGRRWLFRDAPSPCGREPFCLEAPNGQRLVSMVWRGPIEDAPEPYGACLRDLRTALGRTQVELAEAAGLCPNTIGNVETRAGWRPWRSTHDCILRGLRACGTGDDDLAQFEQAYQCARRRCRRLQSPPQP